MNLGWKAWIFLCLAFCALYPYSLFAQEFNLGLPFVKSFPKDKYQAAAQNWDILQDEQGILYFANADGLLTYDAQTWKVYPLPNKSILRSIELSAAGHIFAGGQNEFGVFKPNQIGDWQFHSLKSSIPPEHQNFNDVWNLLATEKGAFFRAAGKLFHLAEGRCRVYDRELFSFLGEIEGRIFVQGTSGVVYEWHEQKLIEFAGLRIPEGDYLTGICLLGEKILLASLKHGFFEIREGKVWKWDTPFDTKFREQEIRTLQKIGDGQIALGTSFGGLIVLDANQEIRMQIKKEDGLLRNRILNLYKDKNANLWLGLDNGINHVQINSPFTRIYPDGAFHGTGYDVKVLGDKAYFGTGNGLYKSDWKAFPQNEQAMNLIPNSKGQVWGVDIINDQVLMSHNKGGFSLTEVKQPQAKQFFQEAGVWTFEQLKQKPEIVFAGTYTGLSFFERMGNSYNYLFNLPEFAESSRFVEQDNRGNIWIAHPNTGIYRIEIKEDIQASKVHHYGKNDGLPSDWQNHLFLIRDTLVFCGEKGTYLFDYQQEHFIPYPSFDHVFGEGAKIRRLKEVPSGDIWFVTQDEIGFLSGWDERGKETPQKVLFPEIANQLNKGFEQIYGVGKNHVFITTEEGFIHYNSTIDVQPDTFFKSLIREVYVSSASDSLVFSGIFHNESHILTSQTEQNRPAFSHNENAFRFSFSASEYTNSSYLKFRHKLIGFHDVWSPWSSQKSKEYTNLSPGTYQFELQALSSKGTLSDISFYAFKVLAPWYANPLAYTIYLLGFLGLLLTFYGSQRKKIDNLREDHQKEIVASEKEIDKLKEEKIQAELAYKQRELVTATMHLVQKKEMLEAVKNGLKDIRKKSEDEAINKQIQGLLLMLRKDAVFDEGWEQFMAHFTGLHEDLFQQLKTSYPSLTPKDLKLCAYLRMNLTTKEMAALQNVTVRGIEASRYRLRKKFNLKPEINLTEFLMAFKA